MPEPADNAPETEAKKSRGLGSYVLWGFVVVMGYVLSWGPAWRLFLNEASPDSAKSILWTAYKPLLWAHRRTPLHKPLGIYMHLWCPDEFNKQGELPGL